MGADGGHIHPRAAVAQACRRAHGAGPDAGGEAIVGVVGPGDCLVEVGEWRDKDDGAEDFAAHDFVGLLRAFDDGEAVVKGVGHYLAAGRDFDMRHVAGAVYEAGDTVALAQAY